MTVNQVTPMEIDDESPRWSFYTFDQLKTFAEKHRGLSRSLSPNSRWHDREACAAEAEMERRLARFRDECQKKIAGLIAKADLKETEADPSRSSHLIAEAARLRAEAEVVRLQLESGVIS